LQRPDGRRPDELRPVKITRQYTKFAPGSVLIEIGDTKVLVTATIEERTPRHVTDDNTGWMTAEYALLPGSTHTRAYRERMKVSGRTHEIQRLIGRSLRASIDLTKLGDRTITIDADVIQADGGTRTASITAGYVAMMDALFHLQRNELIKELPPITPVAAISAGILNGVPILDLNYEEDSNAEVDANLVMTAKGEIIEFQATSEKAPLSRGQMDELLDLAEKGIRELLEFQQQILGTLEGAGVL
jgi:ribonuclease PH